jgi:hypothetical protein
LQSLTDDYRNLFSIKYDKNLCKHLIANLLWKIGETLASANLRDPREPFGGAAYSPTKPNRAGVFGSAFDPAAATTTRVLNSWVIERAQLSSGDFVSRPARPEGF